MSTVSKNTNSVSEPFSFVTTVTAALFFSLTLWAFGPANIYFTNTLEFNFSFTRVIPYLAAVTIGSALLLTVLVWLLRKVFYKKSIALIIAVSAALWLQGNVLVWDYGPLDGRDIYWGQNLVQGLIDSGLWILLIILALFKSDFFHKIARKTAVAFIVIQLISLSLAVFQAPETPSFKRYYVDESTRFTFSPEKNVIILMLDTFQTDVFNEIINEDTYYKDIFRDFTYFRNTLSAFPKTYTSVPSFLTGNYYDNSVPMQDFLKKAYTSTSSVPKVLKDRGCTVELFPYPGTEKTIYFNEAIATNIKKRVTGSVIRSDVAFLLDISLFRYVPHFAKRFVYNDQLWLLKRFFPVNESTEKKEKDKPMVDGKVREFSPAALRRMRDVGFIRQMLIESVVGGTVCAFKYYHLNGLHRPLVLDEKLDVKKMSYSERSSFKTQGKACLEITKLFLDKLRELGVYDKSLIIVMADHGCADYPYGVKLETAGLSETDDNVQKIPPHIKAAGLPMLVIKPFGAAGEEIKISDAPVSLSDLPATIFTALGVETDPAGHSAFDLQENDTRTRKFYYYNWSGWVDGYLYHMQEYVVNGHSWLDGSWRQGGVLQPANAREVYRYGTEVRFCRGGNAARYQGIGWHGPGNSYTWSREKTADLYFNVTPPTKDLQLRLVMHPYLVPGKCDKQEVHILVNHTEVKTLTITDVKEAEYTLTIPRSLVPGSDMNITFYIPTAVSPVDLGIGTDVRTLGVAVKSVVLEL